MTTAAPTPRGADPAAAGVPVYRVDELLQRAAAGVWEDAPPLAWLSPEGAEGIPAVPAWLPVVLVAPADGTLATRTHADIVVSSHDELVALAARMRGNPLAALVLAQLLRTTHRQPVHSALASESQAFSLLLAGPEFARWLGTQPAPRWRASSGDDLLVTDGPEEIRLTLNRPRRANMLSMSLRSRLTDALGAAAATPGDARPVLIDGHGKHFCAGGDVEEFGLAEDPLSAHHLRSCVLLPAAMAGLAPRLTARVHGKVVGAGLELAAFAHRVVAHPDTTFRLPETAMGLLPGCGGTVSVPRRVGRHRFLLLCLSDLTLNAREALEWGLIDAIEEAPRG